MRLKQLKKDAFTLPLGFPTGPWETADAALVEIHKFTKNTKTDGGGFACVWGGRRDGTDTRGWERGVQKKLICHEHGQPHCCKWNLWLEHCVEGWAIFTFSWHDSAAGAAHSHALLQTQAEANARPQMRGIPEEHLAAAKNMVAAGASPKAAWQFLQYVVLAEGKEVTFTYQDVYHATGASTKQRALDATNLVETLRQREQEQGLFYRTQSDEEGCLKNVFYAMPGAHELYAVDAEHQVVEFDTKVRALARWRASRRVLPCSGSRPALLSRRRIARFCSMARTTRGSSSRFGSR
jgi:hypothetical protein